MRLHLFGASALVSAMEADLNTIPPPLLQRLDWADNPPASEDQPQWAEPPPRPGPAVSAR